MRDLADLAPPVVKTGGAQISEMAEDSKYASSRIKIQFIEFLCDKTGGAHIGEMAEDSQIPYRKTIKSKI